MLRFVMAHQSDRIALGILDKRHPFVHADRPQTVIAVAEDELRLRDNLDTVRTQRFQGRSYVIDLEIDQRARRSLFQQQPDMSCLEEQQPGRIEDAGRLCIKQALVEGLRSREVIGMLSDLQDVHESEFGMDVPLSS